MVSYVLSYAGNCLALNSVKIASERAGQHGKLTWLHQLLFPFPFWFLYSWGLLTDKAGLLPHYIQDLINVAPAS